MAHMAKVTIEAASNAVKTGTSAPLTVSASGVCALINGIEPIWTNGVNAAIGAYGELADTASGAAGYGAAGAVTTQTIVSGDGFCEFTANPSVSFSGRQFFAGLTTKTTNIVSPIDIEFAVAVFEGGVLVMEQGVEKLNARAPRVGGVYRIAIEEGQIVYRADSDVIYRSDALPVYPLRMGAIFFNRGVDKIGGVTGPLGALRAYLEDGSEVLPPPFTGTTFNCPVGPNGHHRFKILTITANDVTGFTFIDGLLPFAFIQWGSPEPLPGELPCATQFIKLPSEYKMTEVINDDLTAIYNSPSGNAVLRWRIVWNALTQNQGNVLDEFFDQHRGRALPFFFYDYRFDQEYDNCRFTRFDKDHKKLWVQKRTIEITYRPRIQIAADLTGFL